jgi:hypothetical protein
MARKQPKQIIQMTVAQFEAAFPDEEACDAYLVARRWPNGVICPRCGSDRPYPLKTMKFKWECPDCSEGGYRFSNIAGTIFENTNVDLRVWYCVIHLLLTSNKSMSARQIHRYFGFGSYKTAWYMCHRIRTALVDKDFDKLGGVVEVDQTYVGGKAANKHKDKRDGGAGGIGSGKSTVIGAISRKSKVVLRSTDTRTLDRLVHEAVWNKVSLLCTDEHSGYRLLNRDLPHRIIRKSVGDYVVGAVQTNTIEGFWSILKRGVVGIYHKVSRKYLLLHVAEFQFRHNDIFGSAMAC